MSDAHAGPEEPAGEGGARILCDIGSVTAADAARAGALWRLAEPGRQLDANIVRIPPEGGVETHIEPDLDVLLVVVAGDGTLDGAPGPRPLAPGSVVWLPHGSARSLTAGRDGLSYLTVHRRRPGMRIARRPPE